MYKSCTNCINFCQLADKVEGYVIFDYLVNEILDCAFWLIRSLVGPSIRFGVAFDIRFGTNVNLLIISMHFL